MSRNVFAYTALGQLKGAAPFEQSGECACITLPEAYVEGLFQALHAEINRGNA